MNIYSRIEPTKILHIIYRKRDIMEGRADLTDADEPIQVAAIKQQSGKTFRPHHHIPHKRIIPITQESWVIISGCVKVMLYDLDNSILHEDVLEAGDISITLEGGHNYYFMQDSIIYEYKNGPFEGVENDKIFID